MAEGYIGPVDQAVPFVLFNSPIFNFADQIGLTPEEVISKIMANPDVAMAFQNPKVQAAIMDCSQNPLSIAKYQNDKENYFLERRDHTNDKVYSSIAAATTLGSNISEALPNNFCAYSDDVDRGVFHLAICLS
ncbi:hypothetical protein ACLOJK_016993 [Asimina triloba]